ncbi:MAG: VOC family protein [Vicinamibacterales bacterium]
MAEYTGTSNSPYGLIPAGFRLPASTRLGAVHLQVADLERSIVYYQRTIGLRVVRQKENEAELGGPDARSVVHLHEKRGVHAAPRRGAFGLFHFAVLLPDRASLGRFVRHLSHHPVQAGMADHLVSEALYLTDPDGLGIEVYADRPAAMWTHEGRELHLVARPGSERRSGSASRVGTDDGRGTSSWATAPALTLRRCDYRPRSRSNAATSGSRPRNRR